MKVKFSLLVVLVVAIFAIGAKMLILDTLKDQIRVSTESAVEFADKIYNIANQVPMKERFSMAELIAKDANIIGLLSQQIAASDEKALEERHFLVFERLEILNQLDTSADYFVVIDETGREVARTLNAKWKPSDYAGESIFQRAMKGDPAEGVWFFEKKFMVADAVPVYNPALAKVVGVAVMLNGFSSDFVLKKEKALIDRQIAFFSGKRGEDDKYVLGSSLNSGEQLGLEAYLAANIDLFNEVLANANGKQQMEVTIELDGNDFVAYVATYRPVEGRSPAGYMVLGNLTEAMVPFRDASRWLWMLTLALLIVAVPVAIWLVGKSYEPLNFVVEGAHQVIMRQTDSFSAGKRTDLEDYAATMNLMLAVATGKEIIEDEQELRRKLGLKGGGRPVKAAPVEGDEA